MSIHLCLVLLCVTYLYIILTVHIGIKHPDAVVETSSMSSIEPPDIHYRLSLPEATIDYGELSALQLESITYASQRHVVTLPSGDRAGFLIGDGAGVGKGRTLAGIIFENYLLGRKRSLWYVIFEREPNIQTGRLDINKLKYFIAV